MRRNLQWTNHEERRKILVVKPIVESASVNRKSESSNSSIGDELKFESSITSGTDKGNSIKLENSMMNKEKKNIGYSRNGREREEGAAAPNQRQGQNQQQNQQQQQNQEPVGHQQQHLHINWSHFKPEFSGKPEEDAEAHLVCSND